MTDPDTAVVFFMVTGRVCLYKNISKIQEKSIKYFLKENRCAT